MKNTILYGVILALVVVVIALGYSKFAGHSETATGTVVATESVSEAVGTDEEAAENTVAAASDIAVDAAVDATAEAQQAAADTTAEAPATAPAAAVEDAASAQTAAAEDSLLAGPATTPAVARHLTVADMMADRVLGNPAAPVTIVEFASYTCSHCASFHNTVLPTVKEQLIATGKAKLVLREFPLDKFALKASLLARCAPADKYYDLVEVIFRNQERWIKSEDPVKSLKQLGGLTGMEDAQMEECLNNTEMENAILTRVSEAQQRYSVNATPTFIFNEGVEKLSGSQSPERFQQVVDQLAR